MKLPNFLIIGAQKSGTSWAYRFCKASGLFMPKPKELTYFNHQKRYSNLGLEGYAKFFADWNGEGSAGEATPGYFWVSKDHAEWGPPPEFNQDTPRRVRDALGPDVKLVLLLRNPIDRALSAHLHHVRKGRIAQSQTIGDTGRRGGIVHIGFYHAHLSVWLDVFRRENFWICTYEDLFANRLHMTRLAEFLGAGPDGVRLFSRKVYVGLGFRRGLRGAVAASGKVIATPSELETLQKTYAHDVSMLTGLGVDTTAWRQDFDLP